MIETVRIQPSHPSQGDFVVINKEDFDPEVHKLYEPKAVGKNGGTGDITKTDGDVVEIPADWKTIHHMKRVALATAITGEKPESVEAADAAIAAEVAKREAAKQGS